MARVNCFHNIAHCIMEPVGENQVHCTLGGDVRGEAVLPFDPRVIQGWIAQRTALYCFNFGTGFKVLEREYREKIETCTPMAIRKWAMALNKAAEERKGWDVGVDAHKTSECACSEHSWRPSKWAAEVEDETPRVRLSKWA